jgi:hypothetical protein
MSEASISRVTQIEDPALRAFAQAIANGIMAAGLKAAAHHASPKQFALPGSGSLEQAFLGYLRSRPLEAQQKLSAKALPIVTNKKVPGLEGLDLAGARPALELMMERTKLGALTKGKSIAKSEAPLLVDGALGFRQQEAVDQLQFHLISVKCIDETDGALGESGSDEIAFGGLMVDAGGASISIPQFRVGDFANDGVIKDFNPPVKFGSMDFRSGSGWPKTFSLVLTLVELDNGNFPALLQRLVDEARTQITTAVSGLAAGVGNATLSQVIMAALEEVLDLVFGWLQSWWEDDLFKPLTTTFSFDSADTRWAGQSETAPMWFEWKGHAGHYKLWYKAKLAVAAEAAQASGAIVYEHSNYGGKAVLLPVGHYTLAQMRARGMDNDKISSMKVGAGMRVIGYDNEGFAGEARMYTGSVAQVGDFNDRISSIVVEPMRVMLFQHGDFGGASQAFGPGRYDVGQLTIGNDVASSVLVPPGYKVTLFTDAKFKGAKKVLTGDTRYVGNDFNDFVSSLIVELA